MIKDGINHLLPSHNGAVALHEACQSESESKMFESKMFESKMLGIAATHINMGAQLKFEQLRAIRFQKVPRLESVVTNDIIQLSRSWMTYT